MQLFSSLLAGSVRVSARRSRGRCVPPLPSIPCPLTAAAAASRCSGGRCCRRLPPGGAAAPRVALPLPARRPPPAAAAPGRCCPPRQTAPRRERAGKAVRGSSSGGDVACDLSQASSPAVTGQSPLSRNGRLRPGLRWRAVVGLRSSAARSTGAAHGAPSLCLWW